MARPIKNNADYFPHDADMRNDPKIKAIRRKFGIEGYGVYAMLLEFITDSDFFEFKNDSISLELVAGDFDIDTDKLISILQYCFQLDLFQLDSETNIISCKSLDNRLEPLLSKRKRDREQVIDSDNTQSKVEQSKAKKKKIDETRDLVWFANQIDEIYLETLKLNNKDKDIPQAIKESFAHLAADPHRLAIIDQAGCKKLVNTWLANTKTNNKPKNGFDKLTSDKAEADAILRAKYGYKTN